ncbi:uncharacterized protein LOC141713741 isoform X3 [Apium graveolens]|uniref:uncharacterized protein LOC141668520 isoform X3 n=1 Tax=Apium graveolens TaxID=4045 RepID=UPI003D791B2B
MARKFFVGGHWKCNGTLDEVKKIVAMLNDGAVPSSDVVGNQLDSERTKDDHITAHTPSTPMWVPELEFQVTGVWEIGLIRTAGMISLTL